MRLIAVIPVLAALLLLPAGVQEVQAESSQKQASVKKKAKSSARTQVKKTKPAKEQFLRIP
jgi:hypothetical protein